MIASIITLFISGILHGARERYHADPKIFEKLLGVSEKSFFGSKAWLRQYENFDPLSKHKIELFNSFRDYWHSSGLLSRLLLLIGAFASPSIKALIIAYIGFVVAASSTYKLLSWIK